MIVTVGRGGGVRRGYFHYSMEEVGILLFVPPLLKERPRESVWTGSFDARLEATVAQGFPLFIKGIRQ